MASKYQQKDASATVTMGAASMASELQLADDSRSWWSWRGDRPPTRSTSSVLRGENGSPFSGHGGEDGLSLEERTIFERRWSDYLKHTTTILKQV